MIFQMQQNSINQHFIGFQQDILDLFDLLDFLENLNILLKSIVIHWNYEICYDFCDFTLIN